MGLSHLRTLQMHINDDHNLFFFFSVCVVLSFEIGSFSIALASLELRDPLAFAS